MWISDTSRLLCPLRTSLPLTNFEKEREAPSSELDRSHFTMCRPMSLPSHINNKVRMGLGPCTKARRRRSHGLSTSLATLADSPACRSPTIAEFVARIETFGQSKFWPAPGGRYRREIGRDVGEIAAVSWRMERETELAT